MKIKLAAIEYYLPEKVIDNSLLIDRLGFEESFLKGKLGINERRHTEPHETCSTLAVAAIENLFTQTDIESGSIEYLITVTQTPDYKLPNVSPMIQKEVNLRTDLFSLDISLGCSGFVYALATAKGLMATNGFQRGLIVTTETYSKLLAKDDRSCLPLFGDAAAAVLIEASSEDKVGAFDFGTDGSGAEALILRSQGCRHPQELPDSVDNHLFMNGRAIYSFMMKRIPQSVQRCLNANQLSENAIDFYVFHQASKFMLDSLRERLDIPKDKMVYHLFDCGNTVSSSIPIALKQVLDENLNKDKNILISGFGVGLSWATTIIRT